MKVKSPLEVYQLLPKTNCGECGEPTCMAFASKLINRDAKLEDCIPLVKEDEEGYNKLAELLAPEVKEITIGVGERAVKIGGDDVLYRHQLTFFNPTALFYDVWDTMDMDELKERVSEIENFRKFYVGEFLTLDGIAIRSVSGDPEKFKETVKEVVEITDLPLVLCSFDPSVLKAGMEVASDRNPLIYGANKENWKEVLELVMKYDVPVTLCSFGDLNLLKSMAITFRGAGVEKLVLDPGTFPSGEKLRETFHNFLKLRRGAILEGQKEIAYPLMGVPATAWLVYEDELSASYWEAVLASLMIVKYGDILILHGTQPHSLLAEVHIRETIYTDPRTPVQVEAGIREIGEPDENSPVFVTTNFALTYYTVESDLSSNGIDCYLAVVNTDGIGVEAAVAGGQLTAQKIKETLDEFDFSKLSHRTVVIPGLAARVQGELEDLTGLKVFVGPQDSGRIPGWMEKNWPPEK
jgi:acetyl-CoA decarbonylase/synthase complex subunit gamma